jgi:hypothetical protein
VAPVAVARTGIRVSGQPGCDEASDLVFETGNELIKYLLRN